MARTRLLPLLAIASSAIALFATLWIVIEPPNGLLWLIAVASTEWSLYPGVLGLGGAACGLAAAARGSRGIGATAAAIGLAAVALSVVPWIESDSVARANGAHLSLDEYIQLANAPALQEITRTTEIYAGPQGLALDIYGVPAPNGSRPTVPAVIVVHGGSWREGHRSDFETWDRWLAAAGYVVFDIDYRLKPQPNWKLATGDVKAAIGWVRKNARQLGIDPGRIALLGRSAGGQLALLAAYTPGDPSLPPTTGGSSEDTSVRCVVSLYGPTDLVWGYDHTPTPDVIHSQSVLGDFLGGSPATVPAAYSIGSPINHVGAATPPTLLVHGSRDLIVCTQHSRLLETRLKEAGRPVRAVYIPYALHGFDYNFHGWGSQIVKPVLLKFLRESLGAPSSPKESADKL